MGLIGAVVLLYPGTRPVAVLSIRLRNSFSPYFCSPTRDAPIAAHDADKSIEMATHILFESASGYAIFEVKLREEIAAMTEAVQKSIQDLSKFKKMVSLVSFSPFKNAAHALENANDISEGTPSLIGFSFRFLCRAQVRSTRT